MSHLGVSFSLKGSSLSGAGAALPPVQMRSVIIGALNLCLALEDNCCPSLPHGQRASINARKALSASFHFFGRKGIATTPFSIGLTIL